MCICFVQRLFSHHDQLRGMRCRLQRSAGERERLCLATDRTDVLLWVVPLRLLHYRRLSCRFVPSEQHRHVRGWPGVLDRLESNYVPLIGRVSVVPLECHCVVVRAGRLRGRPMERRHVLVLDGDHDQNSRCHYSCSGVRCRLPSSARDGGVQHSFLQHVHGAGYDSVRMRRAGVEVEYDDRPRDVWVHSARRLRPSVQPDVQIVLGGQIFVRALRVRMQMQRAGNGALCY